jgi:CheY-like chemotaxis protein
MIVVDRSLMKMTILLLVSDSVVRSILKETLEREGYTVLATGDLGQAVDRLQECIPDLLITRTYIESLPGHEAAMYLRTKCPEMRVLMLGGLLVTGGLHIERSSKDLRYSQSHIQLQCSCKK